MKHGTNFALALLSAVLAAAINVYMVGFTSAAATAAITAFALVLALNYAIDLIANTFLKKL